MAGMREKGNEEVKADNSVLRMVVLAVKIVDGYEAKKQVVVVMLDD